jgi:hypothetical protein
MPLVAFTCSCKTLFGYYKSDGEAWVHPCPKCGVMVSDAIGPHGGLKQTHLRLPGDQYDYVSPIDGAHIASKRAHRDHLKRHGVIELGNEKPKLGAFKPTIPRESLKREMQQTLERMKSDGTWRER